MHAHSSSHSTMGIFAIFSLLALLSSATRADFPTARDVSLATRSAQAPALPKAEFTVPFTSKVPRRASKKNKIRRRSLNGAAFDEEYVVNVTVGGKVFNMILDTGSSDTWVVHEGFSCLDLNGTAVPAATCDFGPAHFNPVDSPTFKLFANTTFFEIGVPNQNAFLGDGVSEGVLGLAFSALTSVYAPEPENASLLEQVPYNPFFINAVEQKKVENPFFSISLDRATLDHEANDPFDANLGLLAFGGIVPVPVLKTSVTVPLVAFFINGDGGFPSNASDAKFFWYAFDIDSYTFPGSDAVVTTSNATYTDSGGTFNYAPTPVAAAFNAQFSPPATRDADSGLYVVDGAATAPAFAVVVGGTSFDIDPRDQIIAQRKDSDGNVVFVSGTQDGGPSVPGNLFTLDVFLHNVVTAYNPVARELTITQRVPY
ncbi:acid protease [Mycena latifolia]|nr:acid protease [Mycena latifolia]